MRKRSRSISAAVDLGRIDLLVREGFYSNRTDLIRTAIRNQLASHSDAIRQSISRNSPGAGFQTLRPGRTGGVGGVCRMLRIKVLGSR